MVRVFDAALKMIARHRVYYELHADPERPYACYGCDWRGVTPNDFESHLATMIDEEVD